MELRFIKSGVSKENNFAWVLCALREVDEQGWLVKDQLVIAQQVGAKKAFTAKDVDKVPAKAWRPLRNKEEGA